MRCAVRFLFIVSLILTGAVFLLSVGPTPARPGKGKGATENEAEKLFRAMEKKIKAADAFRVAFEIRTEQDKSKGPLTGYLLLMKDNKVRLSIRGDLEDGGGAGPHNLMSDGKRIKTTLARLEGTRRPLKNLHALLSTTTSRGGVWLSLFVLPYLMPEQKTNERTELDPESLRVEVWDFRSVASEKVGGRDARVIRYRLGEGRKRDDPDNATLTLWIDAEALLPLRRILAIKRDGVRVTETYSELKLNP